MTALTASLIWLGVLLTLGLLAWMHGASVESSRILAEHELHQRNLRLLAALQEQQPGMDFLSHLRFVSSQRWTQWSLGELPDPVYCSVELGGECGEVLNVVKKLEREKKGWAGSRATVEDLGDEIGDVLICLDTLAGAYGLSLAEITARKFNKTSAQRSLPHRLQWPPAPAEGAEDA